MILRRLIVALLLIVAGVMGLGSHHSRAMDRHDILTTLSTPWPRAPYLGQVTTHTSIPNTHQAASSLTQFMSRSVAIVRDGVPLKIAIPNFSGGGLGSGGTATVTASLEYPAGTCTPFTFGGASSATIASGSFVVTDYNPRVPPTGATVWWRIWYSNPTGGVVYVQDQNTLGGEVSQWGLSGVADRTVDCSTIPSSGGAAQLRPIAAIGMTRHPAPCLIGDSRGAGSGDTYDATGDVGEMARSLGGTLAYLNLSIGGAATTTWNNTLLQSLGQYCTAFIDNLGINDFVQASTAAQVEARQQTIRNLFPGVPFYLTTVAPDTTSTDNWATLANQTPFSGEAQRVQYNTDMRAGFSWITGYFENANIVESAQNSGKWQVNGTAKYCTGDGVHETQVCYLAIEESGIIEPSRFRPLRRPANQNRRPGVRVASDRRRRRAA